MVILTSEDHMWLVLEGVGILNAVNESLHPAPQTFAVLGRDPKTIELKSFWWKVKNSTCNEIYNL